MRIKVCGMRDPENINAVGKLDPDYMGFIFFPGSPRDAGGLDPEHVLHLPRQIHRVGVFVNETTKKITDTVERYGLTHIQLHGSELPEQCKELREVAMVVKAFGVSCREDLAATVLYEGYADYFLYDTKSPSYGGTGIKFDHSILEEHSANTPFFLSGGLGPGDTAYLKDREGYGCLAVDINSGFESSPGHKKTELIAEFIKKIRT